MKGSHEAPGADPQSSRPLLLISSFINATRCFTGASLAAKMVNSLPTMQETRIRSLGQEDPLEKRTATHSSLLPRRIPWVEEPGGLQSLGWT